MPVGVPGAGDLGSTVVLDLAGNRFLVGAAEGVSAEWTSVPSQRAPILMRFETAGPHRWTRKVGDEDSGLVTATTPAGLGGV